MKVAVVGSRGYSDHGTVWRELSKASMTPIAQIISGGAEGPDTYAEGWAKVTQTPLKVYKPDWIAHGKAAGPIRNKQIIEASDKVLAFWDGSSRGTKSSIDLALKLKKELHVFFQTDIKTDIKV